ncbi:MAG: protein kinase, partial [Planctomycetota bacterium JB042]
MSIERDPPSRESEPPAPDLVALCLDRLEREGPRALEELCREHPREAADLRARVAQLEAYGLVGRPPERIPERVGEFRLVARIGGGGMGVVYEAEPEGLGRRVALKVVRPGQVHVPGARERFRREVDVLARLRHPGIVPVYAGGRDGDVPYVAMELVRGATLQEALDEFPGRGDADSGVTATSRHRARLAGRDLRAAVRAVVARRDDPGAPPVRRPTPSPSAARRVDDAVPPLYSGSWISACVRIARHVAAALEHAHGEGVLHRDVKPSNVMLTDDGRVLLLDFGLAAAEGSVRLTGSGQTLGSPAYMSPEQMRGEHAAVDARADVYALGVTLYESLTLHQPFAAPSVERTARLVLAAHPPAPRALNPAVPRDVETVVLAALEPDAARRYAGAAAFGADLDALLELRPIAVRRPGPWLRVRRFAQRRPALATAGLFGVLLAGAGPIGGELNRLRSVDAIRAARDQSERDFQASLTAIGHVLRELASDELEDVPRMQRARLVAIDRALGLFAALERDRPDEELLLFEGAALHGSRGDVLRDLGRPDEALVECEAALRLRRRLAERADDPARDVRVAEALGRVGGALAAMGRHAEALPPHAERIELLRSVGERSPERIEWRRDLALALTELGEAQLELGRTDEAEGALGEALELVAADPAERSDDADSASLEGRVCGDLALLARARGELDAALAWAGRAVDAHRAAEAGEPGRRRHAYDVAAARGAWGQAFLDRGRFEEAEAEFAAALAALDELLRDFPDAVRYRALRSRQLEASGVGLAQRGRLDEARALFEERVAELDRLCELAPERVDLRDESARALLNLATASVDLGRTEETLALLDRCDARLLP